MDRSSSYLITGANGFLGAALARELCQRGERPTLLFHHNQDHPFLAELDVDPLQGDVLRPQTFKACIGAQTRVIHCAAHVSFDAADEQQVIDVIFDGTRAVVEACLEAGARSLVFVSAGAVWGAAHSDRQPVTETSPYDVDGASGYALGKQRAERACMDAARRGLRIVVVNPVTVYGDGDLRLRAGGRVVAEIRRRGVSVIPPGGTSWIDVDDVVQGILLAEDRGESGQQYILGAGNLSYQELFSQIARELGQATRGFVLPSVAEFPLYLLFYGLERANALLRRPAGVAAGQIRESFRFKHFSADRARRELGFAPRVSLAQSLQKAIAFSQAHGLFDEPPQSGP